MGEIGVNINKRDIDACQKLSETDKAIVTLRVKEDLKHLDTSTLS